METQALLLTHQQIDQKISHLAYQVYEDNVEEKEIIVAGIAKAGFVVAKKIAAAIEKISPLKITLAEITINKHSQHTEDAVLSLPKKDLNNKVVIVVDDVLNSGKTMMYS